MAFTCDEILRAFSEHDSNCGDPDEEPGTNASQGVIIQLRCPKGPGRGYYRIWGPSAPSTSASASFVLVENWNGVVGVHDKLAPHIAGLARRRDKATIAQDDLGYGCGPSYGCYWNAIPISAMGPGLLYPTPGDVVKAVLAAFAKAGLPW